MLINYFRLHVQKVYNNYKYSLYKYLKRVTFFANCILILQTFGIFFDLLKLLLLYFHTYFIFELLKKQKLIEKQITKFFLNNVFFSGCSAPKHLKCLKETKIE